MARKLSNYSAFGVSFPNAYFAVTSMIVDKAEKTIRVWTAIWMDQATREAGSAPLPTTETVFDFDSTTYAAAISGAPVAGADGTVPTNVDAMLMARIYTALLTHPKASAVLTGSTAV